jgi:membrane protease YdiL (CAAX protease family)
VVVCCICFGQFILSSMLAVASGFHAGGGGGGFTDDVLLSVVAMELPLAALAIAFLRMRGYAVLTLMPAPTWRGCAIGLALYVAGWMIWWLLVSPLGDGLPEQPIAQIVSRSHVTLPVIILTALVNGSFEEVFLLGFLQRGLRDAGLSFALGAGVLVRVLYHLYQGPLGALDVLVVGVLFGLYYARTQKLWPPVLAHILADIVPLLSAL